MGDIRVAQNIGASCPIRHISPRGRTWRNEVFRVFFFADQLAHREYSLHEWRFLRPSASAIHRHERAWQLLTVGSRGFRCLHLILRRGGIFRVPDSSTASASPSSSPSRRTALVAPSCFSCPKPSPSGMEESYTPFPLTINAATISVL